MLDVIDLNLVFSDHLLPETVVHHLNLHMEEGDIVGLVGESGLGKSMTALGVAGLLRRHDLRKTGQILFRGMDLLTCPRSQLRSLQGNEIGIVFQEPMTSLNPAYRIGWQVEESLRKWTRKSAESGRLKCLKPWNWTNRNGSMRPIPTRYRGDRGSV